MTRAVFLSIYILLAITCLMAFRHRVGECRDAQCTVQSEGTEGTHYSQSNDSAMSQSQEYPKGPTDLWAILTKSANLTQAAPFRKLPRKWCGSTTLAHAYCEAPCQDYEYGELPNLQGGPILRFSSRGVIRLARMDDSKDVIVKMPLAQDDEVRMKNDALQYKHLRGIPGIPDLLYAGPLPHWDANMSLIIDNFYMSFAEYMDYWKSPRHSHASRWPQFGELATLARKLLAILKQVHKRGYRHRHITPQSMMFKNGELYLTDLSAVCPIGKDICNIEGHLVYVAADHWFGKEQNVKDDLEMVINLIVFTSGQHTWDECEDESNFVLEVPLAALEGQGRCLYEKKKEYLAKPTPCGVTGLDVVAKMIRSFDPTSGEFDYDAAIALLKDHSALRFPTQEERDAERAAAKEGGQSSSESSLVQFSTSHSMSSMPFSSAGSVPHSSSTGSVSNSPSASIVKLHDS